MICPVLACSSYVALSTLPSYHEQRAILCLFVNFVLSNMTLNLMVHNMSGRPYPIFQKSVLLLLVPLIVYHGLGVSAETEVIVTRVITLVALLVFVWKMIVISVQWCQLTGKPFFILNRVRQD